MRTSGAKRLAAPVQLAAIDAGSNAIRLVIARATSPNTLKFWIANARLCAWGITRLRAGYSIGDTISRAARAFRQFRDRMDQHQRECLPRRGHGRGARGAQLPAPDGSHSAKAGIELEVISSEEEARLVCSAVQWTLGDRVQPRVIFDLGGGSLELNFFQRGVLEQRIGLPLGTIRLMETYSIDGAIDEDNANRLRHHILALLRSAMPSPPGWTARLR